MNKIGRRPNLIRYSSQAHDAGEKSGLLRARTLIYPTFLLGIVTAFVAVILSSKSFDAVVLREEGIPHTLTDDRRVRNLLRLKLTNRSDEPMNFTATVLSPKSAQLVLREEAMELRGQESKVFHFGVLAERGLFVAGRADFSFAVTNQHQVSRELTFRLIGPYE